MSGDLNFGVVHSDLEALNEIMPASMEQKYYQASSEAQFLFDLVTLRNQAQGVVTGLNLLIEALGGEDAAATEPEN